MINLRSFVNKGEPPAQMTFRDLCHVYDNHLLLPSLIPQADSKPCLGSMLKSSISSGNKEMRDDKICQSKIPVQPQPVFAVILVSGST